jgi:hypothetical protein
MQLDKLITANEAATAYKVCANRIRRLCRDGRIPGAVKKGNQWLLPVNLTVTPGRAGPTLTLPAATTS